jgi:formamidase
MAQGGGRVDEIITAELRPDLVREARSGWGVENNIYQLYHRGYVAVKGGAQDCPYTYMHAMAAGTYQLPWGVQVTDGTSCGFAPPTRNYKGPEFHPLVPDAQPVPEKKSGLTAPFEP